MIRTIIIGQAPSRLSEADEPLSGRSGKRLAELCGVPFPDFLSAFERLNLHERWPGKAGKGDAFDRAEAGRRAFVIHHSVGRRRMIFLGWNVARAFGFTGRAPLLTWIPNEPQTVAISPHPSGVNRWWNDPANLERARRFWREAARGP